MSQCQSIYLKPTIITASTIFFVTLATAASGLYNTDPRLRSTPQQQAKPYQDLEAYRVYSAILPRFTGHVDSAETLLIRGQTISYSSKCLDPSPSQKNFVDSAIANYDRVNRSLWKLERHFELKKPYELVSETDFNYRARTAEFPGFIELSAIGFNSSKTIAVVYIASFCRENFCRAGNLIVARKQGERWRDLHDPGLFCWWKI
jgi:hypothetical protein